MDWQHAQATLRQIIDDAVPELRGMSVELREMGTVWQHFAFLQTSPFTPRIYAVPSIIETLPDQVVRGLLAHELMHVLQFSTLHWPHKLWLVFQ